MAISPSAVGALPNNVVKAPYKGGVLPASSLTTYGCHAKALQPNSWTFNLHTGVGGGADYVSTYACPQYPYRLGSQSSASASGSEEVSIAVHVPSGIHNVSVDLRVNYTAMIRATAGNTLGVCPTNPIDSVSASYYNGSGWSYSPTISRPVHFTNKTYYYNYEDKGASGSCASFSSVDVGVTGYIVASNGLAGYSLTPTSFQVGGYVWLSNSTYWACSNYTLWSYGTWSNGSRTCYTSNQTQIQTCVYPCIWPTVAAFAPTLNMSWANSSVVSMWANQNYSASRTWDLFLNPFVSLNAYTDGFPQGRALGSGNLAGAGNGVTVRSITIK